MGVFSKFKALVDEAIDAATAEDAYTLLTEAKDLLMPIGLANPETMSIYNSLAELEYQIHLVSQGVRPDRWAILNPIDREIKAEQEENEVRFEDMMQRLA